MKCPLCSSADTLKFSVFTQERGGNLVPARRCKNCGLEFLQDYSKDRNFLYEEEYSIWGKSEEYAEKSIALSKRTAFRHQLNVLKRFISPNGKRLLDIGTGKGYLLDEAERLGFECYGVEVSKYSSKKAEEKFPGRIFCGPLEKARYSRKFDVITMTDLIEHISNPLTLFEAANKNIKKGGLLFIMTPNTDSLTRKALGKKWFQYKFEHVLYWNKKSLIYLLDKYGFELLLFKNNEKRFNLEHYHKYFEKYSLFGLEKIFQTAYKIMPQKIRMTQFNNPITGEFLAIAKKK